MRLLAGAASPHRFRLVTQCQRQRPTHSNTRHPTPQALSQGSPHTRRGRCYRPPAGTAASGGDGGSGWGGAIQRGGGQRRGRRQRRGVRPGAGGADRGEGGVRRGVAASGWGGSRLWGVWCRAAGVAEGQSQRRGTPGQCLWPGRTCWGSLSGPFSA